MEPKEYDREFPRGDTCPLEFELIDENKNPIELGIGDELYFTVKQNYNTQNAIFQKKYSNGDITVENGQCSLIINSSDTNTLNYGTYVYDIAIKSGDYRKTVCLGQITLTNEATFVGNE